MKKELVFLLIGEERTEGSFIRKVEKLIQIPVDAKTTFHDMFLKLGRILIINEDHEALLELWKAWNYRPKASVFESELVRIIPDPEIKMFAIFDLVTVK